MTCISGNQNPNETLDSTRSTMKHVQVDFLAADVIKPVMRLEPIEITTTEEDEEKYTQSGKYIKAKLTLLNMFVTEDITTEESEGKFLKTLLF